jgi:hypothetical protein
VAAEVHASFQGLAQYADLSRRQRGYVESVDGLVNGACGNFGAFTGFMALFAGAYRDAHEQVTAELARAARGAGDMATNLDAVLADFRATDHGVSQDFDKLIVRTECAPGYDGPSGGGEGPGMPAPIKTGNAGLDTLSSAPDVAEHLPQHLADGLPGRTPPLPDGDIRGLPTDGVELTTQVMDTIAAGQSIGEAQDDEETYEEFESEHGGARR